MRYRSKGVKDMARGKSFKHKEKGHPGKFPEDAQISGEGNRETIKQVADFATFEAFKNRVKENEE